ncbi:MAG: metallophosphoesterase family protein [Thermodesulfobacteriota bacterium]
MRTVPSQPKPVNAGGSTAGVPIGIMADSHGKVETIAGALALFRQWGCGKAVHLGDICDSFRPAESDACVRLLKAESVLSVKGNNDHALVVNRTHVAGDSVSSETIDYLNNLPMQIREGRTVFAHSLPFEAVLGLSCMVRTPGAMESEWFFREYPDGVLFRGHSHQPEMKWRRGGHIVTEPIAMGQRIGLEERRPCIVTCGALTRGWCMIFQPDRMEIVCRSIGEPGKIRSKLKAQG